MLPPTCDASPQHGGPYRAYAPDELMGWELVLPGDLAVDVADAEAAVRALNAAGVAHASLEGLARFLLRAESVSSSHIEGLDTPARRLLRAELSLSQGGDVSDRVAAEILGNVAAMDAAIHRAARPERLSVDDLLAIHAELMRRSPMPEHAGTTRTSQNWVGGSSFHPLTASFVPPPPDHVEPLLRDLVEYVSGDEHSSLVQAAIAHAQFETIHPFADGNGRTGRALIQVVLRRRRLVERCVPPVSLVLAAWRSRLGRVRRDSAVARLLSVLPGSPVFTVASASQAIGRSVVSTGQAVHRLEAAGIVKQRGPARQRYRIFEAREVIALFTGLERMLASPDGNTRSSPPERPVPRRSPARDQPDAT